MRKIIASFLAIGGLVCVIASNNACTREPDICPPGQTWFICDIEFSPPNQCGCKPYWKRGLPFCGSDIASLDRQLLMDMGLSQVSSVRCVDTLSSILPQSNDDGVGGKGTHKDEPDSSAGAGPGPDPSAGAGMTFDECAGACSQ